MLVTKMATAAGGMAAEQMAVVAAGEAAMAVA